MLNLILLIFWTSAEAGLTAESVSESALRHHPEVLAAQDRLREAKELSRSAKGAYDARIVSDYRRQTKSNYQTTLSRTVVQKPLRFANSKVYAGSEQISNPDGALSPIYNTGNPTSQTGNYSLVGIQVSLLRNLIIDKDRGALRVSQVEEKNAEARGDLSRLSIARNSQIAYWDWVTARKLQGVYEALLKNGEFRSALLGDRQKKGDIAQILVTENEQYLAGRKGALEIAKERLARAELNLALYNRGAQGEPIIPLPKSEFQDFPKITEFTLESLKEVSEDGIEKRPELRELSGDLEKSEIQIQVSEEDLKPQLDISTEFYKRTESHPGMPQEYLMVMAQVSIPIERNLGKGNVAAARARKLAASRALSLGRETYLLTLEALKRSLVLQREQVRQSRIELDKSRELVASETYKFHKGGSNLFLVNLREESQARAEVNFHEAQLRFMQTLLEYQFLGQK